MLAGWFLLAELLYGILYAASHASEGVGLMHLLNILLMWILGPGFGGFLATYITSRLFKTIDIYMSTRSFITVSVTLAILIGFLSFVFSQQHTSGSIQFIIFIFQVAAIVIGSKIGKILYIASNAQKVIYGP